MLPKKILAFFLPLSFLITIFSPYLIDNVSAHDGWEGWTNVSSRSCEISYLDKNRQPLAGDKVLVNEDYYVRITNSGTKGGTYSIHVPNKFASSYDDIGHNEYGESFPLGSASPSIVERKNPFGKRATKGFVEFEIWKHGTTESCQMGATDGSFQEHLNFVANPGDIDNDLIVKIEKVGEDRLKIIVKNGKGTIFRLRYHKTGKWSDPVEINGTAEVTVPNDNYTSPVLDWPFEWTLARVDLKVDGKWQKEAEIGRSEIPGDTNDVCTYIKRIEPRIIESGSDIRIIIASLSTVPADIFTVSVADHSNETDKDKTPIEFKVKTSSGNWYSDIGIYPRTLNPQKDTYTVALHNNDQNEICSSLQFTVTGGKASPESTHPINIANQFISFALGAAGGVAFLVMLFGAYRLMFAAGNPESIQQGREVITAAVVGLIVVIFAVFLLRLIGVSVLGLPIGGLLSGQ